MKKLFGFIIVSIIMLRVHSMTSYPLLAIIAVLSCLLIWK